MNWEKIVNHPLIDKSLCVKNYDGYGRHHICCIDGYKFENTDGTIDIGNLSELSESIKHYLVANKNSQNEKRSKV